MVADSTMRMAAVNGAPTTGTVMRWNKNDAPQIMPSSNKRIIEGIGISISACVVAAAKAECSFRSYFTIAGGIPIPRFPTSGNVYAVTTNTAAISLARHN